ncbi:exported hypothetical protein [Desulfamplus magnetovallimortis]|uniref:Uncharacterized protein n=1 Tax=Desulfamplus magnetovallimortis TaxID=1246637 RepID=A0A1W1H8M5_9BACT|nr:hypothetical protein [Desulfamplus magnetovallimortis]SLM28784.1 exported hypothetical protein [Desulfamplus magnetovallimortis]
MKKSIAMIIALIGMLMWTTIHAEETDNLLQNPDAEDGLENWSAYHFSTIDSSGEEGLFPRSGNFAFRAGSYHYTCTLIQVIDISSYRSIVDTGTSEAHFDIWSAVWASQWLDDWFKVTIKFLDEFGALLNTEQTGNLSPAYIADIWTNQETFISLIPINTALIELTISTGDLIAFDDLSLKLNWDVNNSFIELNFPQRPISANAGQVVVVEWSTNEEMPEDQIIIEMKRDAVNESETVPDDQNWYRFTEHGASSYNDGVEEITIPEGLTKSDDWRLYIRTVDTDILDFSDAFTYNGSIEDDLDAQYEAGKQYCIENPELCGLYSQENVDDSYSGGYAAGIASVEIPECIQDYTEEDLTNSYNDGYTAGVTSVEIPECIQDYTEEDLTNSYNDGYTAGYTEGYEIAEEDCESGTTFPFTGELPETFQTYLVLTDDSVPFYLPPGSYVQGYGSNGANTVNVRKYARVELMNCVGENQINIEEASSQFTVYRSGAVINLNSNFGTLIKIAATSTSQVLRFADGSSELIVRDGFVMIGNQIVEEIRNILDMPLDGDNTSEDIF